MAHKTLIDGTAYDVTGGRCLVDGTGYGIQKGRTLVDGTGYDVSFTQTLGDLAPGSVVYINESKSPVEFYVANHNYEDGLNGVGRTLLVRKALSSSLKFSASRNDYASSSIDDWLNDDYKTRFDASVRAAIGETTFYCREYPTEAATTLTRSVFLLSLKELGATSSTAVSEGSEVSIASTLKGIAYDTGGTARDWWLRTASLSSTSRAWYVAKDGDITTASVTGAKYIRPCFTLPDTTLVSDDLQVIV